MGTFVAKVRQNRINAKQNPLFLEKRGMAGRVDGGVWRMEHKKNRKKHGPFLSFFTMAERLLSVMLIRYAQLLASFGTTGSQHATAVLGGHSLTETVLVHSPAIVGLECSFHFSLLFYVVISRFGVQK